ncbi:MAG: hypothetical protein ACTTJO_02290 [Metamycoplasmataceae bacterium]
MNKIKTILTVSLIFPLPLVFVSCKVNQKNINQDLNKINIQFKNLNNKTINQINIDNFVIHNKIKKYNFFYSIAKDEDKKIIYFKYWYEYKNLISKKIIKEFKA